MMQTGGWFSRVPRNAIGLAVALLAFSAAESADQQGNLWIANAAGIVRFSGERFEPIRLPSDIRLGRITAIAVDSRGVLWICDFDKGLFRWQDGTMSAFDLPAELISNPGMAAYRDSRDRIWIGFGAGTVGVLEGDRFRTYSRADGVPTGRVHGIFEDAQGRIWLAVDDGLSRLDNGRFLSATQDLRLPPRVAKLQIDYTALSLTAPGKVRFRHRLEGVDSQWVDNGINRQAIYAHLPPGVYRFEVAAHSGDRLWRDPPTVWAFSVQPTFYQTRMFWVGCAVAISLLMFSAWQLRVRQLRRQFSIVLGARARVAREIHDTLLQSLVGMAVQLDNLATEFGPSQASVRDELGRMRRQVENYIGEAQRSILDLRSPAASSGDLGCGSRQLRIRN